jgi:BA14K-like protein
MKNRMSILAAAALFAMSIVPFTNSASATPVVDALALKNATPTNVETVRWRGRGYYGRGHYGPGWGVGAGLLGGAIIGGMLAAPYYGYGPYAYEPGPYVYGRGYGGNAVAYCMRRFKSYDPGSGTYLGYDGYRHPCP